MWDCENRKPKIFTGHNKKYAIKKIVLSISGDCFLALSEDGTIKKFVLSENDLPNNGNIPPQSPRHKQPFWKGFFETMHDDSIKTFSIHRANITDMKFALTSNKIAACTSNGTIVV